MLPNAPSTKRLSLSTGSLHLLGHCVEFGRLTELRACDFGIEAVEV